MEIIRSKNYYMFIIQGGGENGSGNAECTHDRVGIK